MLLYIQMVPLLTSLGWLIQKEWPTSTRPGFTWGMKRPFSGAKETSSESPSWSFKPRILFREQMFNTTLSGTKVSLPLWWSKHSIHPFSFQLRNWVNFGRAFIRLVLWTLKSPRPSTLFGPHIFWISREKEKGSGGPLFQALLKPDFCVSTVIENALYPLTRRNTS